ncbi:MAG: C-terminal binding protein [Alphaproteobacteria bacterium]
MPSLRDDAPMVVITDYDFGDIDIERNILNAEGIQVMALQAKSEDDLAAVAPTCAGMINQYARIGEKTIERMQQCKVIARYGVGVDIVAVDAATAKNIQVTNVQDYCTNEVADHAIALWLNLARGVSAYDQATHQGIWRWQSAQPLQRIRGQTLGIVSFGKIGRAIAKRARPFGVRLIAYDPYLKTSNGQVEDVTLVSKEQLLRESDAILMQAPMNQETHHFLSHKEFALMKSGALLINTGRGPTVDNKALYDALCRGQCAGAALDDTEEEPAKRAQWSPSDNPLFTHPKVLITPHAAYYSEQSLRQARETAAHEVARVLKGLAPSYPVNHI